MIPQTKYRYGRYVERFEAFRATAPELPLEEAAVRFLQGIRQFGRKVARAALKTAYPDLPWYRIRFASPRRDEGKLQRTLLSEGERQQLRATATDPQDRALLACLWTLRRFEAAKLRWGDLDWTTGLVSVVGKGDVPAWTLFPEAALADLRAWYVAVGRPGPGVPVFPNGHGDPVAPHCVSMRIRQLLERAGLYRPGRGGHAFRRTFATRYLRKNTGDIRGLQKLLRHATIATTALYDYPQPEDLRARLPEL